MTTQKTRRRRSADRAANIQEQCYYVCGPYKGYCGRAAYDHEAESFHGDVSGTRDVITFEGKTIKELRAAFMESVDDYLDFCAKRKESPDKPYSGKFVTRIDPELHRKVSTIAELSGKSLNQFICDRLEEITRECGAATGQTTKGASDPQSAHATRHRQTRGKTDAARAEAADEVKRVADTKRFGKTLRGIEI